MRLGCDFCGHSVDPRFVELFNAARDFVHFSFAEEEDIAIAERRAVSSVPFVRVERRLRAAVRALEAP